MADAPLVHVIPRVDWMAAGAEIRPASLAAEGFVHLSTPEQIRGVCDRWYADRDDLVLLVVDADRLGGAVVWEDLYGHGDAFPHLYGPLPRAAVTATHDYAPGPDGGYPTPPV